MNRTAAVIELVAAVLLSLCTGNATADGAKETAQPQPTNQVSTVLVGVKPSVVLGDPIKVTLNVEYQGPLRTEVDKSCTAFDCFEIADPDGQSPTYVGFNGQIMSQPVGVVPSSTVTIVKDLDLTDKYLFAKTGRYTIRFRGESHGVGATAIVPPRSNAITIDITQGHLTELDELVSLMLPIRPQGWVITKSERDQKDVTPFGRNRVAGYYANICRNYMIGEVVYVWLTKIESPVDPAGKDQEKSEPIGHTHGLHVYVTLPEKAMQLWPTAIADISRVLNIDKE